MTQQPNEPVYPGQQPAHPTQPFPQQSGPGQPLPPQQYPPQHYPPQGPSAGSSSYSAPHQSPFGQTADRYTGSAPLTARDERNLGMLSHVIPLVCFVLSAGTLGFVASLVMWFMYKDRGPFVRANAANSLNVQLTALIWSIISVIMMISIILLPVGIIGAIVAVVYLFVVHIVAAMKASAGEWYKPPFTMSFFK
ncbi:DUF4870 domain-containing protein [Nostocoides australiense]|nr:DUF4870 domain-containing protein [Tetrasphaera australiensis]HRW01386.1 DUF4870 domain-containing protein [Tetrasphaera sp.]